MKDAKGHGSNPRGGGVGAKPIPDSPYHKKSDAELHYIMRDANEAAQNMRGVNAQAEGKYLDQVNDAATVLGYRSRGGVQDKDAAAALAQGGAKSAPVPVHPGAAGRSDAVWPNYDVKQVEGGTVRSTRVPAEKVADYTKDVVSKANAAGRQLRAARRGQ